MLSDYMAISPSFETLALIRSYTFYTTSFVL